MCNDDKTIVLNKMEELWKNFIFIRSKFPTIVGSNPANPLVIPEFYKKEYPNLEGCLLFEKGISNINLKEIIKAAHYINQNFIIRLAALLDSEDIVKSKNNIKDSLHKSKDVKLLIDLRNVFAHETGNIDFKISSNIEINKRIVEHYELVTPPNDTNEFRLPINDVLKKMFEGCKEYVKDYYDSIKAS